MFQEALIPEDWGIREGVGKWWVGVIPFLSLVKAPFRAVDLLALALGFFVGLRTGGGLF